MSGSFTKLVADTAPTMGRDRADDANATTARRVLEVRSACAIRSLRADDLPFACCDADRPPPRWSIHGDLRDFAERRGQWCRRAPGNTRIGNCREAGASVS